MAKSLKQIHGKGIVGTDWGFIATLSPAALTLYAPFCGWSVRCRTDSNDAFALAEVLRNDSGSDWNKGKRSTVALKAACNRSTVDRHVDSDGIFGLGPGMDLRALKPGRQVI